MTLADVVRAGGHGRLSVRRGTRLSAANAKRLRQDIDVGAMRLHWLLACSGAYGVAIQETRSERHEVLSERRSVRPPGGSGGSLPLGFRGAIARTIRRNAC